MKKSLTFFSIAILTFGLMESCSKSDDTQPQEPPIKNGVWTNYPDRTPIKISEDKPFIENNTVPLLMQVSGADVLFSTFSVEKEGLNLIPGALTYDASSNKGTISIPPIGEYEGIASFTMNGNEKMTCITARRDTVRLVWCSESVDGWWETRPARDFVIPDGEGLSRDTGVGGSMMDLVQQLFGTKNMYCKGLTKMDGAGVFNIVSGCFSIVSTGLSVAGLFGEKPSNAEIMEKCNEISAQISAIDEKIDGVMSALEMISTQIDLESLQSVINTRKMLLNSINNSYSGYVTKFNELSAVPQEKRDHDYYDQVYTLLSEWSKNDSVITDRLYNTIEFLLEAKYQNGGKFKQGLPLAYDDMLLATVAFEHEYGLGGEAMRMEDMSVIVTCLDWASLYLQACEKLGCTTISKKNPTELLKDIDAKTTKMQEFYNTTNVKLDDMSKRRVCYVKDAHFIVNDLALKSVNYQGITLSNLKYAWGVSTGGRESVYDVVSTYDFFKFLGEGDPQVLANQYLVSYTMLNKVRDFYYAAGTQGFRDFYKADNISKLMMLDYSASYIGDTEPWLICNVASLAYVTEFTDTKHYLRYGERKEQELNFKVHGDYYWESWSLEMDDNRPICYFIGHPYK